MSQSHPTMTTLIGTSITYYTLGQLLHQRTLLTLLALCTSVNSSNIVMYLIQVPLHLMPHPHTFVESWNGTSSGFSWASQSGSRHTQWFWGFKRNTTVKRPP